MNFKDKVIVVTGAGGTLCSELAIRFAEEGAILFLVGRTESKLTVVADKITAAGGKAYVAPCDVTDRESVAALADLVQRTAGPCNYLINGAGGNDVKAMPTITAFDERELDGNLPEGMRGL